PSPRCFTDYTGMTKSPGVHATIDALSRRFCQTGDPAFRVRLVVMPGTKPRRVAGAAALHCARGSAEVQCPNEGAGAGGLAQQVHAPCRRVPGPAADPQPPPRIRVGVVGTTASSPRRPCASSM